MTVSPDQIEYLSNIHKCKVIRTFNGIDTSIYKNLKLKRKKQILAVGTLKYPKGYKYLIKGFNDFLTTYSIYKDYKLIIVGDGPLKKEMKKMINDLKLENNIFLYGQKNRNELIQLYNESEVYISSSIWEGFSKTIIEAVSCGCKVIATNVGSASLVIKQTEYLINPKKTDEICNALKKIINDSKFSYTSNRELINKFSWDNVRFEYSKIIFN